MEHKSVLLEETIDLLNVKGSGIYVDCTLGRGGHSGRLAEKLTDGMLYAFDKDEQALKESAANLSSLKDRIVFIHSDFRNIREKLNGLGVMTVDGIMMDLGVSSPQFDDAERGFSYRFDNRLDMRMDRSQSKDAWQIVNTYPKDELIRILRDYGEERYAPRIAAEILKAREEKPVNTTFELADLIKAALPAKELRKKGHPAKKTFQALRIETNDELGALREGLINSLEMLNEGGRCAVITFHSLEDRLVKNIFKDYSSAPFVEPKVPLKAEQMEQASFRLVNRKPVTASEEELRENNRSHSAKLRVIERIRGSTDG